MIRAAPVRRQEENLARGALVSRMNHKKQTIMGVAWSFVSTSGEQAVTFLVLVVLARLLTPEEFGIVALASLFVLVLQGIMKNSFNQALAQRRDAEAEHFDASFWIAIAIGLGGSAILIFSASAIARLFQTQVIEELIPWLCVVLVLASLETVQESWLMRNLQFRPLAIAGVTAAACGGVVAMAFAFLGHGVWSLVAHQITSAAVGLVIVWWCCDWKPRPIFSRRHAKDVLSFGRFIMGNNVIVLLTTRADAAVVGFFLGPAALGLYNVGQRFLQMLVNTILGSLVRVFLPTFSRIWESDPEQFPATFSTTLSLTSLVTFPTFLGLACVADDAVVVLLGQSWAEAAPVVAILALSGAVLSISWINATAIVALGKPDWQLLLTVIGGCTRVAAFLVAVQWGIVAVAAAFSIVACFLAPMYGWMVLRLTPIDLATYLRSLTATFAASIVMAAVILVSRNLVDGALIPIASLSIHVAIGAISYCSAILVFSPRLAKKALEVASDVLSHRRTTEETSGHYG